MLKIFPLGESALTIEFSNEISPETNDKVINLANYLENNNFPGYIEIVPAYSSLTIFYDVLTVRKNFPDFSTAFEGVKNFAENALRNFPRIQKEKSRVINIQVSFDKENALDLEFVAAINHLKPSEVIEIFIAQTYRVYMLGFLPGFAYLGEIDWRIAAPRKSAPRLRVPKGSVGIAGRQTGIYPLPSPGGWQIIGKTNVELFTPNAESPTFLQAGDTVKFYSEN
ncbi:MAG: 5-oxoprolinase subunit PxpB [Pyrinomonadaceae bacterium]